VCRDPELAALDRRLAEVFGLAMENLSAAPNAREEIATFRAYQRGWISGRDDCWKAEDLRACVRDAYRVRIASLEAEFRLVEPEGTVFWACEGNQANEFVTTLFPTDPPSTRVERGDGTETFFLVPAASGARYEGPFGRSFWMKGDSALVVWPEGSSWRCAERMRR
jgi:uncharacterized protein